MDSTFGLSRTVSLADNMVEGGGSVGLFYSEALDSVYAAASDFANFVLGERPRQARVVAWDIDQAGGVVWEADVQALFPDEAMFLNDLVVLADGTVFVTDSTRGAVYQITSEREVSVAATSEQWLPAENASFPMPLAPIGKLAITAIHEIGRAS